MATYYAWSPIATGRDEKTWQMQYKKPGESVSASSLNVSETQFQQLVDSGAVRTAKYPDIPEEWEGSVLDWLRAQADEADTEEESLMVMTGGTTFGPNPIDLLTEGGSVEKPQAKRGQGN
jgi:hypothetical protein